ncbi:hypothetical protein WJX73_004949 [Symbiochloris irregularis]|uniref:Uncharacterized protein n=1 Tax=Symbiochloris irregularis TaxID=706552 RepID=A0AAW1NWM8_9CHLO
MDGSGSPALVVGTYERFLFGLGFSSAEATLERLFSLPAHKGVIHTVAARTPYLVSGGGDEQLHLYQLKEDADLGLILSPGRGGVYATAFYSAKPGSSKATHLLSGAADGSITVWRVDDWSVSKNMTGHSKAVTGLAVHNSGRIALSTSQDSHMRMWNLVKGKPQHKKKLAAPASAVQFLLGGESYALQEERAVSVYSTSEEGLYATFQHPCRVGALAFISEQEALTGAEDGCIRLWDSRTADRPSLTMKAHKRQCCAYCHHQTKGAGKSTSSSCHSLTSQSGLTAPC